MAFTYSSDATSSRDRLRLQLADTTSGSGNYVFEDGELDAFLSRADSDINLAAAMACRSLAVNHAKRAIWYRVNGFELDRRNPAKLFMDMAAAFEKAAKAVPTEYESVVEEYVDSAGVDRGNYVDTTSEEV